MRIFKIASDNFQKALQLASDRYTSVGITSYEISHGHCLEWAKNVKAFFPKALIKDVDLWELRGQSKLPYHIWIEYEGRAYDSEEVDGVGDFKDLPYFQTHKNQKIIPLLKERVFP